MKKYLGIALSIMMVFTMSFVMAACGSEEETETSVNMTLPYDEFDEKVPSKDIEGKIDDLENTIKEGITTDEQKQHFQDDVQYIVANLPGADEVLGEYVGGEGKEPKTSYEDIDIDELRKKTEEYKETEETQETEESSETEATESTTAGEASTKPTAIELPKVKLR